MGGGGVHQPLPMYPPPRKNGVTDTKKGCTMLGAPVAQLANAKGKKGSATR